MSPGGFTRDRKLNFNDLVAFLMKPLTKSTQRELDDFYQKISNSDFQIREITKGAFTQSRAKLDPRLFIDLSATVLNTFYSKAPYYTFDQYRLLAIDGSTMVLPKHSTTVDYFGMHKFGPKADAQKCMGRVSLLYDVLNCTTLDTQLQGYSSSEAALCHHHITHMKKGDLVLFDRYYASYELMHTLLNKEVEFVFRMKNTFTEVKKFISENVTSKIVTFKYKGHSFEVKLVKIALENGDDEILCTSLRDERFDLTDFKELYHSRWGIETHYNVLKNWLELENFSGKTLTAIEQDLYSKIFIKNLCATLAHPIDQKIDQEIKEGKKKYATNKVFALAQTVQLIVPLFVKKKVDKSIEVFDAIVSKTKEMVRENRSFERKKGSKLKFSTSYKNL